MGVGTVLPSGGGQRLREEMRGKPDGGFHGLWAPAPISERALKTAAPPMAGGQVRPLRDQ